MGASELGDRHLKAPLRMPEVMGRPIVDVPTLTSPYRSAGSTQTGYA